MSAILKYKESIENDIRASYGRRSSPAIVLVHSLMQNPYTTVERAAHCCSLSYKAANDLVKKMQDDSILDEVTGQSRNRLFVLSKYLKLFD